ncbi:MAG TPA: hypothetical protein VGR96_13165 [Acidobacteriaceae bacterium]|nr:hypothetical protein [Acidobacteriaceae bacterium]
MLRVHVRIFAFLLLGSLLSVLPGLAQTGNTRLILKDGSYQVVTQYKVQGDRVRFFSAERGDWEELPSSLVDWSATDKWAKEHAPGAKPAPGVTSGTSPANPEAAEIDKEEQQERAEQAARMPEVAPRLRLPDEDGVWALDTFRDQPELIGLVQNTGDVNQQTGHNVLRSALNPLGGMKQSIVIPGAFSKVSLHVNEPAIYVSLTTDSSDLTDPGSLTVDTHGAGSLKDKNSVSSPDSQYAIVRVWNNLKRNYRVVGAVKIGLTGNVSQTEDIIPTTAQILPGRHWMKLTPKQPLGFGDYALMEILAPGEINGSVWDFRIDPDAPDNKNAIIPLDRSAR